MRDGKYKKPQPEKHSGRKWKITAIATSTIQWKLIIFFIFYTFHSVERHKDEKGNTLKWL